MAVAAFNAHSAADIAIQLYRRHMGFPPQPFLLGIGAVAA
jgi:hypothetical protein